MKLALGAAVLVLLSAGPGIAAPRHVMSLNICTDQLLLSLARPEQIASVTFMAHERAPLRSWPFAAKLPVNYGTAEEILAAHPDLVLAGPFLPPLTRQLLAAKGVKLLEVPLAENFDQIRQVTRLVAKALGQEARGEELIAEMDDDLRTLARQRPARPVRVAEWGNGGYVPGQGGLFGAMLDAAGAVSIERGAMGYYDVEALIAGRPQALIFGDTYAGLASLRADQNDHPALKAHYPRVSYASFYGCGVPQVAGAALALQTELHQAVRP